MMFDRRRARGAGFTLTDLVVIVVLLAAVVMAAAFILPMFAKAKGGPRDNCVNHLKQVNMAFRIWADDHNNKFPMQVSTNDGGSLEYLSSDKFFLVFSVMSNELSTPKILVCPQDTNRTAATNFTTDLNQSHLSYFIGLDAKGELTDSFLCGDKNLTNGTPVRNGILEATTNQPTGWNREIHHFQGNVAVANGYTWQLKNPDLRVAIQKTGLTTNRLALP